MMQIRTASMADLDMMAQTEAVCFPEAEAASRDSFACRLRAYPDRFWLMVDGDGRLVSFVNGMLTDDCDLTDDMYGNAAWHNADGGWQMIFGVVTAPEFRRHGYAEALLRHVVEQCRAEHRKGLVLTCKDHLVHFYARVGFVDEGISASEHGGVTWHQMRLTL